VDSDDDGHPGSEDCDDENADVNPAASEVCDGLDNDCDGEIDEEVLSAWYADADTDGFGDPAGLLEACDVPSGYVADNTDCDDANGSVFPGADEYCNDLDDNCNGVVDEDPVDVLQWFPDADADGYGDGTPVESCDAQFGAPISEFVEANLDILWQWSPSRGGAADPDNLYVTTSSTTLAGCGLIADVTVDVDITHAHREDMRITLFSPSGAGVDLLSHGAGYPEDQDLVVTFNDDAATHNYGGPSPLGDQRPDQLLSVLDGEVSGGEWTLRVVDEKDGDDGVLNSWGLNIACETYAPMDGDCDDADAALNPGANEVCDGLDNNCDGAVDDGTAVDATTWYEDKDSDGYGDPNTPPVVACSAPAHFDALNADDCDDTNAIVNPGMDEVCNDIDDNCDGSIDETSAVDAATWYVDFDSDGFGDSSLVSMTACEASGSHTTSVGGDCDDTDASINPGEADLCGDGLDNDCSGAADESSAAFVDLSGAWSDLSTGLTGTSSTPAVLQFSTDGTAYFCPGTHYVTLVVDADVAVRGSTGVASDVVLDGSDSSHVMLVQPANQPVVELYDLTVANGNSSYGGSIHCSATTATPASLALENTVLQGGVSANEGGAIYAYSCDISMLDTIVENNSAVDGGAIYLWNSDFEAQSSSFLNNTATNGGGAIYVLNQEGGAAKNVHFIDSDVSGNGAVFGGALAVIAESTSSVSGLSQCTSGGGFTQNTASWTGGAVYLEGNAAVPGVAQWQSIGCDYGEPGSSADNAPNDVYVFDVATDWSFGAGALFTCDSGSTNTCTEN